MENENENKKETKNEYSKRYYKENRQKHLDYCNTKVQCTSCDIEVARCRIARHRRSLKHRANEQVKFYQKEIRDILDYKIMD